jgi:hypothetical protein
MPSNSDTFPRMEPEVEKLLLELQLWCRQERGRVKELADAMGVKVQVASNWINLQKQPSIKYWLALQAFAKKIRRRR